MKKVRVESFTVEGMSTVTTNRQEMDPETGKIGKLWDRFFALCENRKCIPETGYGLYHRYETDCNGPFTVTAATIPGHIKGLGETVEVPAGTYLKFERSGPMPQTCIALWQDIWGYFSSDTAPSRTYLVDFEEYRGEESVAIHIGVKETP